MDSEDPAAPRADEPAQGLSLSKYLNALAPYGDGSVSTGVALDLALNDVIKRACSATSANAGAIALADKGEMVCRATTGENAPDLGVRLDTSHGLSGACVRMKEWQRCNDTESDARVNAAVCRHLGVRSILVVPVLNGDELIGVMEIFSTHADAFSDRDVESLKGFSREVVENVQHASGAQALQESSQGVTDPDAIRNLFASSGVQPTTPMTEPALPVPATESQKDFSTTALLVWVVLLALIVGWITGRSQGRHGTQKSTVAKQTAKAQSEPPSTSPPATADEQVTVQPVSGSTAQPKITGTGDVDGGLVITRDGKVVFRSPAQHVKHAAGDTPKAGTTNADVSQLRLPSDVAEHYLVTRVEPEYPEQARKDQVQGSVLLDALVGKDGAVQKVTPVSGNPELVQAATQAIQQWRFRPYLNNGQPQEFTTQVNVVFRLP